MRLLGRVISMFELLPDITSHVPLWRRDAPSFPGAPQDHRRASLNSVCHPIRNQNAASIFDNGGSRKSSLFSSHAITVSRPG
jgi:hypothetical protein